MRITALFSCLLLAACNSGIYTRDGVTDGDAFYLAPQATSDNDPVYQSWVAYSLMKSACQLQIGGENPARSGSFQCEFTARRHLINAWEEKRAINQEISDPYLDALGDVNEAGFLAEYTAHYFNRQGWLLPEGLRSPEFDRWRQRNLRGHQPRTRVTGSWNYRPVLTAY